MVRKVFLDGLPRTYKGIDWGNCVGKKVEFIYDNISGIIDIIAYNNRTLKVIYNHMEFDIDYSHFYNCNIGNIIGVKTSRYKYKLGEQIKEKNMIIIDKGRNKSGKKSYKIKCLTCGFDSNKQCYKKGELIKEYWITEEHLKNRGCPCCANKIVVQGINDMYTTDHWMVELGVDEEFAKTHTAQNHTKTQFTCCYCGNKIIKKPNQVYRDKSIGCSCGDGFSYLSKYILSAIKQLNIRFETEVKYDWNKYINPKNNKLTQASVDFIIYYNGKIIPLEADGGFHRTNNKMTGQTKEMSKYIDKQRDENCLKYLGEETIRITDEGDIRESILNSKLAKLFDLSKVDWLECERFALSNLAKEVCDYWNQKEDWETTTSIGIKFGIFARTTVINYLRMGERLGYCIYDAKEQNSNIGKKYGGSNKKAIEMFKDGISLGVFESATELARKSEELFGIRLNHSPISKVCRGEATQYKGFTFRYVNDDPTTNQPTNNNQSQG